MAILRVFGKDKRILSYIETCNLPISKTFTKGESLIKKRTFKDSGFSIAINNDDFYDLEKQIKGVISFFKKHHNELVKLQTLTFVKLLIVSFTGKLPETDYEIANQRHIFPVDLLKLLAEAGFKLELSLYPDG